MNLYGYCGNDPINYIDPRGLARIGRRPLAGMKWAKGQGPFYHEQIWYDDGTNSGFFQDDTIRSDIGYTIDDYDFSADKKHYDDCLMRQAEKNVQKYWDMDWRMPWYARWNWNNCQDYVRAVKREYEFLEEQRKRQKIHEIFWGGATLSL